MIQLIAKAPAPRAFSSWAEPKPRLYNCLLKLKNPPKNFFVTPVPKDRMVPIFYEDVLSPFSMGEPAFPVFYENRL